MFAGNLYVGYASQSMPFIAMTFGDVLVLCLEHRHHAMLEEALTLTSTVCIANFYRIVSFQGIACKQCVFIMINSD